MRPIVRLLAALAAIAAFSTSASADGYLPIVESATQLRTEQLLAPRIDGDQLFFFFDARAPRVPFLGISSLHGQDVTVNVQFRDESLAVLSSTDQTLPAFGHILIDPSQDQAVAGHFGLVMVTPIEAGSRRPIVLEAPLVGGFTIANTQLGSGFGQNPFGRLAIRRSTGRRAKAGTVFGVGPEGQETAYQQIEPAALVMPFFFNPTTLAPPELDGNRILITAFCDIYRFKDPNQLGHFDLRPVPNFAFQSTAIDSSTGMPILLLNHAPPVHGVLSTTLQDLAGAVELTGSGKVALALPDRDPNCRRNTFGLASQSLGTFAVGQTMPALANDSSVLP
jgi:hypothetical protein